jgi:hypothetical protein
MLTCRDVAESATDFMEQKLSSREWLQVRLHLLLCRFCRLYVRQLSATRDALRRLPRAMPSDEDVRSLLGVFRSCRDDADVDGR